MKILFLPASHTSSSARYRVLQFADPLRRMGHQVSVRVLAPGREWRSRQRFAAMRQIHNRAGTLIRLVSAGVALRDAEEFDLIFMNRDLIPELGIRCLEPLLARRNQHFIFDFDDAIHLGARGDKLREILPCFAAVTAGNEYLAGFARRFNGNVKVWPTVVDTDCYRPAAERKPGLVRVGWSGSSESGRHALPVIRDTLCRLARRVQFELVLTAERRLEIEFPGVNTRFIPWTPETEVAALQQIDIGLMPLADRPFERGKCGAKAILYMAVSKPALVSPVGVNREIVIHGRTGFHCHTDSEWAEAIERLIHNPELRHNMGVAGRKRVQERYSLRSLLPRVIEEFQTVRAWQPHRFRQSGFEVRPDRSVQSA